MIRRRQWDRLNQMVDEAISGEFKESSYDETELSKLEVKWKQFLANSSMSRENLEREKENIKSLISDISHQTKTPIANLKLYEELLLERLGQRAKDMGGDGWDVEKGQAEELMLLEQIRRQTEKLEFLIQSLTKMSRLESNILTLTPGAHHVRELVESVCKEAASGAEKRKIKIETEDFEDFQMAYDRKWTEEALLNLVDNAVKYSRPGAKVIIGAKRYEMYGAITVKDEGTGIPEQEIPKIFHRFYRGEKVAEEEGVGIGLYLAREIVKRQDGYLKVTSEEGVGSIFSIFLPCV